MAIDTANSQDHDTSLGDRARRRGRPTIAEDGRHGSARDRRDEQCRSAIVDRLQTFGAPCIMLFALCAVLLATYTCHAWAHAWQPKARPRRRNRRGQPRTAALACCRVVHPCLVGDMGRYVRNFKSVPSCKQCTGRSAVMIYNIIEGQKLR